MIIVIVGLGNPGLRYSNTRHNIGFMVADKLAEIFIPSTRDKKFNSASNYLFAEAEYKEKQIVLMKPLTYMNASGIAVKELCSLNEISPANLLIIYDDANIDFGMLRLRPSGSDGGQNGIASIIYEMETEEIPRLRIGIRNEAEMEKFKTEEGIDLASFVLSEFTEDEKKNLDKVIDEAAKAVLSFLEEDIQTAMNFSNRQVLGDNIIN